MSLVFLQQSTKRSRRSCLPYYKYAGVAITDTDIQDCHRVGNRGQTIVRFSITKV